jgi:2'-5' RNA ligase
MPNKIVFMEALANYPQQPVFQGSIIKEYLLVMRPVGEVGQQVMQEKENFSARFGIPGDTGSGPEITIASFLAKEEMEETLLRWMHRIISTRNSFAVALNNFSCLPNANTIYLRIQDHQPFKALAKEFKVIDELVRSNGLPKAQLISHPHLVIAKRLEKSVYDKAMPEYSKKDFHAEFQVKEFLLLKRTNQFDAGKQVNVFRLLP